MIDVTEAAAAANVDEESRNGKNGIALIAYPFISVESSYVQYLIIRIWGMDAEYAKPI